ncbi:Aldo/keto reductase, partial [Ascoidea rubescens DSM 1968]
MVAFTGEHFVLSNTDAKIPAIGYGTGTKWYKYGRDEIDEKLVSNLVKAVDYGFVHIDGAEVYNTDSETGLALKKIKKSRESIWITNKYFAGDGSYKARSTEANPYEAIKAGLKRLQIEYIDLYLLHAPFIKKETHGFSKVEAWKYLEKAYEEGLVKNIGVSNFSVEDLKEILEEAKYKPQVNQIEYSAYLQNQTPGIYDFAQENGILLEAYSPLAPLYKLSEEEKKTD